MYRTLWFNQNHGLRLYFNFTIGHINEYHSCLFWWYQNHKIMVSRFKFQFFNCSYKPRSLCPAWLYNNLGSQAFFFLILQEKVKPYDFEHKPRCEWWWIFNILSRYIICVASRILLFIVRPSLSFHMLSYNVGSKITLICDDSTLKVPVKPCIYLELISRHKSSSTIGKAWTVVK